MNVKLGCCLANAMKTGRSSHPSFIVSRIFNMERIDRSTHINHQCTSQLIPVPAIYKVTRAQVFIPSKLTTPLWILDPPQYT